MKVDIEKLDSLIVEADKIFLTPDGEKVLLKLLDIQDQVEQAIVAAKAKLEATGLRLNPDFTSIQSDKVKVYYREFGSKYYVDEKNIALAPKELYTTETKFRIDSKAVEKWADEHKGMPAGILEVDRKKTLSFTRKNK